jgi:hypothetical protein
MLCSDAAFFIILLAVESARDVWTTAVALPTNRTGFGVAFINDILYAIGGYLRSSSYITPTATNEQYIHTHWL